MIWKENLLLIFFVTNVWEMQPKAYSNVSRKRTPEVGGELRLNFLTFDLRKDQCSTQGRTRMEEDVYK